MGQEQIARRGKWIQFVDEGATATGKTRVFRVETYADLIGAADEPVILGAVKWFGRWRRYAFFPGAQTVYEATCLREIADFCADQTTHRRSP
jgi:hypothetical protein